VISTERIRHHQRVEQPVVDVAELTLPERKLHQAHRRDSRRCGHAVTRMTASGPPRAGSLTRLGHHLDDAGEDRIHGRPSRRSPRDGSGHRRAEQPVVDMAEITLPERKLHQTLIVGTLVAAGTPPPG
jgi:diadenosine tetraphosphatase ApaH/serine/threonine PP2A family protein phosphatase